MPRRNRWILMTAIVICCACYVQSRKLRWAGEIGFAMELIDDLYYERTNPEEMYKSAMQGMVKDLDPYSDFITADRYVQFERLMQQEFGGLGIIVDGPPNLKRLTIISPLMGTPAYLAGLEPDDVILAIDGQDTAELSISEAMDRLKGLEGTTVRLSIQREGNQEPLDFTLRRATIELESVVGDRRRKDSKWNFMLASDPDIAYVRLTIFGEKTVSELEAALKNLEPSAKALILDLRDNSGGLLTAATKICDMFLEHGKIVSTKGRDGKYASDYSAQPGVKIPNSVPIVVLLNDQSASASEVVAACLQDQGRAVVAGQRSYGKGSVQNVVELNGIGGIKSALKITTARYFPPSGRNIHRGKNAKPEDEWGVHPDKDLELIVDDQQRRDIFQRWRRRGNPREEVTNDKPDLPEEAIEPIVAPTKLNLRDPVLDIAVEYLRKSLPK